MKDVIFSGCSTRKASSAAEVSIEFDNTKRILPKLDDDTVIITRRAHINGKSEYLINHQPARLRDIQELFLDTGLGSSSYSMIGQEQTKKLLSEKTEERRAIFEEAAGIVKMKNQKELTDKRLYEVEQDFTRLNDILKELERQVKPLEKQSEKAKKYLSIKDVLDKTEIDFLSFKFKRLMNEDRSLTESLEIKTNELNETSLNVDTLDTELKTLKHNLKTVNEEIFKNQEQKSSLKEQIDSLNSKKQINEERCNQSENELKEINAEISEIEQKFSVSIEEFNFKKGRFQELESLIKENIEKKNSLNKEVFHTQNDLTSSKLKAEKLREEITTLYNEYKDASFKFEQQNKDEEQMLKELDSLSDKVNKVESELLNLEKQLKQEQSSLDESNAKINALTLELESTSNMLSKNQKDLEENTSLLFQLEKTISKDKTTLDNLESSFENFEGYFEGVKNVLKNRNKLNGIYDVVSNLFEVENGYEIALDSLLNAVSQNIVVDSIQNAKETVQFLKKNNLGRATFIPMDDLSTRTFKTEELQIISSQDNIFPAISMIKYNDELRPLFEHLLGRYIIAKDMDAAVSFYNTYKIKTKIATLDGDILQPGVISGGTRNKKGLISKRKDIDVLKTNISNNEIQLNDLNITLETIQGTMISLNTKKEELLKSLEEERIHNSQVKFNLENQQKNIDSLNELEKDQEVTSKDIKYRLEESKKISSSLYKKHKEKEYLHNQKNDELTTITENIKKFEETLEFKKQEETNSIIAVEKYEEEKRNLTEFISEQENGKDSFEKRLEFLHSKKLLNESKINTAIEENNEYDITLNEFLNVFETVENELVTNQNQKVTTQEEMDQKEATLRSLRSTLEELKELVHTLNISKTNFTNEINQLLKRAKEAYQLEKEELETLPSHPIDEKAVEKEINILIRDLKAIGPVNLDSVKDFEELNERYQKEKNQLDDVKEAKKDLEMLLKEISTEMTERFITTFKDVAKHFEKSFVELFGGGQAKLSLEEPNKPLTSHILITAQPPGKKPKRMESLSGGEKNLTSCALVFAIIKAKPSPFVYLDEIDAPLDDANVSRFAYYLKKLGDQTQFIVVTHRKGTMMAADTLFGVTQEEQGVTTVFPYHLDHSDSNDGPNTDKKVVS